MKRTLALCVAALSTVSVFAGTGRYWVVTHHPARGAALRMLRDSDDARQHRVREFGAVDAFAADLRPDEVGQLKRSSEVRYVSPVVERHTLETGHLLPSAEGSPYATAQTTPYGVAMVRAPEVWPVTKGGGPINIAILDTGIDPQHPDLAVNVAGGFNTFTGRNNPMDDEGHGTHVAGIIAAADNQIGVVGVAPEARIWAVKVLDARGFGTDENVVAGVDWVLAQKAAIGGDWIMSLSLGSLQISSVERDAFMKVIADGVVVVAAAGNDAFNSLEYPAGYPGVISVGAVDSKGVLAFFSNRGPALSLVAPGVQVLSTAIRGSVPDAAVSLDGNSIAASAVAGSNRGEFAGAYVLCGLGRPEDFPPNAAGNIAVIERGDLTLSEKVRNAQAAKALAVIIYNQDNSDYTSWTLVRPDCSSIAGCDDDTHPWPVVVAVSADDGQRLISNMQHFVNLSAWMDDYKFMSGTSMATPYVTGTVALVWSLAPAETADRVRDVVLSTARDLGDPAEEGRGLVDAYGAAVKMAPDRFGIRTFTPHQRPAPAAP